MFLKTVNWRQPRSPVDLCSNSDGTGQFQRVIVAKIVDLIVSRAVQTMLDRQRIVRPERVAIVEFKVSQGQQRGSNKRLAGGFRVRLRTNA